MDKPRKIAPSPEELATNRTAKRWRFDSGHVVLRGPLQRPDDGGDFAPRRDEPKTS